MIEIHGRLGADDAIRFIRKLDGYNIAWCEEPVAPESLDLLKDVKSAFVAADRVGRAALHARRLRPADRRCGPATWCRWTWPTAAASTSAKKIAAFAAAQDSGVSPHCSIGPVALAAALHFAWSTPNMLLLESFAEFDVDWRNDLVGGWNPLDAAASRCRRRRASASTSMSTASPAHPYRPLAFPSLWDAGWEDEFTGATSVTRSRG